MYTSGLTASAAAWYNDELMIRIELFYPGDSSGKYRYRYVYLNPNILVD